MRLRRLLGVLAAVLAVTALFATTPATAAPAQDPPTTSGAAPPGPLGPVLADLIGKAERDGSVRVIVRLADQGRQQGLLDALTGGLLHFRLLHRFDLYPLLTLEVDAPTLTVLGTLGGVVGIQEDTLSPPQLDQSVPLINGDAAHVAGFTGSGQAVAILDTGIDQDHPFFGNRIVDQACFSTGGAGDNDSNADKVNDVLSLCGNGTASQTGPGSANAEIARCLNGAANVCDHGTHVAGIAAGSAAGVSGAPGDGVAPGAGIVAIQVFTRLDNPESCTATRPAPASAAPCVRSYTSDQIRGLERVQTLVTQANPIAVAAANMSLGDASNNTAACDTDALKVPIDSLLARQVVTVISAGNSGHPAGVGNPGCISTAVTVGAVVGSGSAPDGLPAYTNRGTLLDLLAPGGGDSSNFITSSVPNNTFGGKSGTSMAAPHVTGAFAILRAANPTRTAADLLGDLRTNGVSVSYASNGTTVTTPRIDLRGALTAFRATSLSYNGPTAFTNGLPATLKGTLTRQNGNLPLGGRAVTFTLGTGAAAQPCTATTDPGGVAQCTITHVQQPAGPVGIAATFAGDTFYTASGAAASGQVAKGTTTLTYNGPTSVTNGSPAVLAATLVDQGNGPIAGRAVSFSLGTGAAAQGCTATTDGAGVARCTVARVQQPAGTTGITATFAGDDLYLPSGAAANGEILKGSATLRYKGPSSVTNGSATTLAATLVDQGNSPLAGRTVSFVLGTAAGAQPCTATTDAGGSASCTITRVLQPAGTATVGLSFAGDDFYLPSNATATVDALKGETTVTYGGPANIANDFPATFAATVAQRDGGVPLDGKAVTFTVGTGATSQACTGTTDAQGRVTCTIATVAQPATATGVGVRAAFAGDDFFLPSQAAPSVKLLYYTGRAFALSSTLPLLGQNVQADTGEVSTSARSTTSKSVVTATAPLVTASGLHSSVVTGQGTSTGDAGATSVTVGILGLPVIKVSAVRATSASSCAVGPFTAGGTGSVTIGSLTVAGVVRASGTIAPNTVIQVGVAKIVLNEQVPVPGSSAGMQVNAVHISAPGVADVVIAAARSDIHNCP